MASAGSEASNTSSADPAKATAREIVTKFVKDEEEEEEDSRIKRIQRILASQWDSRLKKTTATEKSKVPEENIRFVVTTLEYT